MEIGTPVKSKRKSLNVTETMPTNACIIASPQPPVWGVKNFRKVFAVGSEIFILGLYCWRVILFWGQ